MQLRLVTMNPQIFIDAVRAVQILAVDPECGFVHARSLLGSQAEGDERASEATPPPGLAHTDELCPSPLSPIRRVPYFIDVCAYLTSHFVGLHLPGDLPQVRLKDLAHLPPLVVRLVWQ